MLSTSQSWRRGRSLVVQVEQVPQVQVVMNTTEIHGLQIVEKSLALARHVSTDADLKVGEIGESLPVESALHMFVIGIRFGVSSCCGAGPTRSRGAVRNARIRDVCTCFSRCRVRDSITHRCRRVSSYHKNRRQQSSQQRQCQSRN